MDNALSYLHTFGWLTQVLLKGTNVRLPQPTPSYPPSRSLPLPSELDLTVLSDASSDFGLGDFSSASINLHSFLLLFFLLLLGFTVFRQRVTDCTSQETCAEDNLEHPRSFTEKVETASQEESQPPAVPTLPVSAGSKHSRANREALKLDAALKVSAMHQSMRANSLHQIREIFKAQYIELQKSYSTERTNLQSRLTASEDENKKLHAQIRSLQQDCHDAKQAQTQHNAEKANQQQQVADSEELINHLQAQINSLNQEKEHNAIFLEMCATDLQQEAQSLKEEMAHEKQERSKEISALKDRHTSSRIEQQKELDAARKTISDLQNEKQDSDAASQKKTTDLQLQIENLQKERDAAKQTLTQQEQQTSRLGDDMQKMQEQIRALEQELRASRGENQRLVSANVAAETHSTHYRLQEEIRNASHGEQSPREGTCTTVDTPDLFHQGDERPRVRLPARQEHRAQEAQEAQGSRDSQELPTINSDLCPAEPCESISKPGFEFESPPTDGPTVGVLGMFTHCFYTKHVGATQHICKLQARGMCVGHPQEYFNNGAYKFDRSSEEFHFGGTTAPGYGSAKNNDTVRRELSIKLRVCRWCLQHYLPNPRSFPPDAFGQRPEYSQLPNWQMMNS